MRTIVAMSSQDENRQQLSQAIAAALADLEEIGGAEERYRGASWLVDRLAEGVTAAGRLRARAAVALRDEENLSLAQLGERLGLSKARAADIVRDITRTSQPREPETRPVVAVIVTSSEGVLAVRRTDKKPLWTFPSGELEPGESASDAGVRETKEETGLNVGRPDPRQARPPADWPPDDLSSRTASSACRRAVDLRR